MMTENKNHFLTADLMKKFNIGRNTLRLYEEMGLLIGMKRTETGYRHYDRSHLEDIQFILKAKEVGFTLNEIKSLLDILRSEKNLSCGRVSNEVTGKIQEIESEIKKLESQREFLGQFLATCQSKDEKNRCDVIGAGFDQKACCG